MGIFLSGLRMGLLLFWVLYDFIGLNFLFSLLVLELFIKLLFVCYSGKIYVLFFTAFLYGNSGDGGPLSGMSRAFLFLLLTFIWFKFDWFLELSWVISLVIIMKLGLSSSCSTYCSLSDCVGVMSISGQSLMIRLSFILNGCSWIVVHFLDSCVSSRRSPILSSDCWLVFVISYCTMFENWY